jgi:hypothetical protein
MGLNVLIVEGVWNKMIQPFQTLTQVEQGKGNILATSTFAKLVKIIGWRIF